MNVNTSRKNLRDTANRSQKSAKTQHQLPRLCQHGNKVFWGGSYDSNRWAFFLRMPDNLLPDCVCFVLCKCSDRPIVRIKRGLVHGGPANSFCALWWIIRYRRKRENERYRNHDYDLDDHDQLCGKHFLRILFHEDEMRQVTPLKTNASFLSLRTPHNQWK